MSCYAGSIALNTIGINPILAMVLYQGGRISFKSLDNIFNIKSNIKTKFDLKKAEFINILKSKKISMYDYVKSIEKSGESYIISFKDKAGEIFKIIIRKEDLSPYERYICFNGCFVKGTQIITKSGLKKIDKIEDGEFVLSKSSKTGEISYKKCTTIKKLANEIVTIIINNEEIKSTSDHLFMTKEGWLAAEELEVGSEIVNVNGNYEVVEKIKKESYNEINVYNLEVEDYHTFFVGTNSVLVHNEYSLKNLNKIYDDYVNGIPDEELKIRFKETLDNIKNSGNDNILKDFDQKLKSIAETDIDSIRKLVDETNQGIGAGIKKVTNAVEDVKYGDHFTKVDRKKALKPNVSYETHEGYKYKTNKVGAITEVEGTLKLGEGNRNLYAQRIAGGDYRLTDDDGGHLIASQFLGSGELDNLVPMNSQINRCGGKWYNMEQEWAKALKEGKEVKVKIEPKYDGDNLRPISFKVKYNIDGQRPKIVKILNQAGG